MARRWLLDDPTSRWQARVQRWAFGWQRLRRNPAACAGLGVIGAMIACAMAAPWLATHDPLVQNLAGRLAPPGPEHLLGSDAFGRDIWSRLVWGSRITLRTVALAALIVGPLGLAVGSLAGALGGWVDAVLMRLTDIFLAFPRLILALALTAALGPGIDNAVIAIGLTGWPPLARLARAEALTARQADFVAAARVMGAGWGRIWLGQILPLCLPSAIVRLTLDMAGVILIAAGLGFLGLGAQPPSPEWGAMIAAGRNFVFDQWWLSAWPGLAICLVSLGFNLLGDGLRDVLDPKAT